MNHVRVCNLRCLADSGVIDLKPITLLVGANSSGKSSFLRVFPLLRQSSETRTASGLLLNEGDVNFGFFPEAVHRDANPKEMKLEFGVKLQPGFFQGARANGFLIRDMPVTCEITYARRTTDPRYPFLRSVRLRLNAPLGDDVIEISADEEGKLTSLQANQFVATGETSQLRLQVGRGLVPTLIQAIPGRGGPDAILTDDASDLGLFEQTLLRETDLFFHKRTARDTRLATLRSIHIGSPADMLLALKQLNGPTTWNQQVQGWTPQNAEYVKLRNLVLAKATVELLSAVNMYVSEFAGSVQYFQPVRAGVQRDYVSRDVQTRSVDPSGLNVAMVLASLPRAGLMKFREWMRSHFGFEVYPQSVSDGARVALRMKEAVSDTDFNLADMGFGFSQMLPFLVQIWKFVEDVPPRYRVGVSRFSSLAAQPGVMVAIEQPELHLHPGLQARLADLFVAMLKPSRERNLPLRFMLETHSSAIIERIGQLVAAGTVPRNDVQVLLFERGAAGASPSTATIRRSEFDDDGILQDWPTGFLSPPPDTLPLAAPSPPPNDIF